MNFTNTLRLALGVLVGSAMIAPTLPAADGSLHLAISNDAVLLKIDGDKDDDWWVQTSTNLITWTTLTNFGTLLSGNATNAPWRSAGPTTNPAQFYRARQTPGLYDPALFRTVNLVFTQTNWSALLANSRTYQTNTLCWIYLDNGATNYGVGARYKGNTSYTMAGTKKSINLDIDFTNATANLMDYTTVNLNNATGDETIMREPLFFTIMSQYTPCPKGSMARVHVNGSLWGVYSLIQQENSQLIRAFFPSDTGDRWRAPNATGGGGGFSSSNSAFAYFGNTNIASYRPHYEMKTTNSTPTVGFQRLINAIYVLNTTPPQQLRDRVEDVFAVDNWLWMLAIENLFVDDDSYWNKGADYGFYYEPESGRIHPVEHDGNEAFTSTFNINSSLSPVFGLPGNNRPLLNRLLPINELRQRYLAHMRTVLEEYFNPGVMTPMINSFHRLSMAAIIADPNKGFTLTTYTNDLNALKTYVTKRYHFLMNHAELTPMQPNIVAVTGPASTVYATNTPFITAQVTTNGTSGLGSVWLYHRGTPYGRFAVAEMLDDGAHGDGVAVDGVFGAATTNYPAGTRVRYYIEARGANAAQAARFSPARAEKETHSYRVALTTATNTPVIINEFLASNSSTLADPQGEFDDWIELHNLTDQDLDLTGLYLSNEPNNPRKWQFPAGTRIHADGYLLIWADEDTTATPGLHASFKLEAGGDQLFLADSDANLNAILDSVAFEVQPTDRSYGRSPADADVWTHQNPTPSRANE